MDYEKFSNWFNVFFQKIKARSLATDFYLSFSQSDSMKGLLILLIIWAHNDYLVPTQGPLQKYIYLFHVSTFFILPFLYQPRQVQVKNLKKTIIRCYLPFFITLFWAVLLFRSLSGWRDFSWWQLFRSILIPQQFYLKQSCGFYFLWFLPAYCATILLKYIVQQTPRKYGFHIIVWSMGLFLFLCLMLDNQIATFLSWDVPFAISFGIFYCGMGILAKEILAGLTAYLSGRQMLFFSIIVFIILSMLYLRSNSNMYFRLFFPISFFLILYSYRHFLSTSQWLVFLGKASLIIYLVHIFFYNGLKKIMDKFVLNHYLAGIIVYCGTVIFSIIFYITLHYFREKLKPALR